MFIRLNLLCYSNYHIIILTHFCMLTLVTAQDFTVPSLKFETGCGYARQPDEQSDSQNEDLEGYQIDVTRAWESKYVYMCAHFVKS